MSMLSVLIGQFFPKKGISNFSLAWVRDDVTGAISLNIKDNNTGKKLLEASVRIYD